MAAYTKLTNLEVTGKLKIGDVASDTNIVEVTAAESTPTKAEFNALVAVVNALTADLGRPTT